MEVVKPKALSVTELNTQVKNLLENTERLRNIAVEGEVSNWKVNASGHAYFALKDAQARVTCVAFKFTLRSQKFLPKDGEKIILIGRVGFYAPSGTYQLIAELFLPGGEGDLHAKFEALKKKLAAEGLFARERKRVLPRLPQAIGIVTSPTGAAVHDIIRVARERNRGIKLYLYPAKVQGEGAAAEVCRGIEFFNRSGLVDLLIVGRGGGSDEDLWCFNDEQLVRAVAGSILPVVSAVGHEVDITLCDFAADVRAATPSNAAELSVPDVSADLRRLEHLQERLHTTFRWRLQNWQSELANAESGLQAQMQLLLQSKQQSLQLAVSGLENLSPLKVLSRGYSVTESDGRVLHSVENVAWGSEMTTVLPDGKVISIVQEVQHD